MTRIVVIPVFHLCTICIGPHLIYGFDDPSPAVVFKHTQADGNVIEALLFKLPIGVDGVSAHDHIVFVDTSASQIGAHRMLAIAVLDAMLKSLPESDRVRLFAVDLRAEPLMSAFANPQSAEVSAGIAKLKARIPLGATNLKDVVRTALNTHVNNSECSIVYLGDGMSTAELLETREVRKMVSELRVRKIPFHSYGVGPEINLPLLGILAHQTGGYVDFDNRYDVGRVVGDQSDMASDSGSKLGESDPTASLFS